MAQPKTKLEYLRKINFMTQSEVAESVGITQSYYQKIERGIREIPMSLARKLKVLFKVNSIDELLDDVPQSA